MLDIQFIYNNQEAIAAAIKHKGVEADLSKLLDLDRQRRQLITALEELRQKRNQLAASQSDQNVEEGRRIKGEIAPLEKSLIPVEEAFQAELYRIPNLPSADTPIGNSEADSKILYSFGAKPEFDFQPKAHWEMSEFLDEERAVRLSGKRFTFLKGDFVLLQLALIQYGFDVLTDQEILAQILKRHSLELSSRPFLPILPPTMMRTAPYLATNRLQPHEMTFKLADNDLWLTGSVLNTPFALII